MLNGTNQARLDIESFPEEILRQVNTGDIRAVEKDGE